MATKNQIETIIKLSTDNGWEKLNDTVSKLESLFKALEKSTTAAGQKIKATDSDLKALAANMQRLSTVQRALSVGSDPQGGVRRAQTQGLINDFKGTSDQLFAELRNALRKGMRDFVKGVESDAIVAMQNTRQTRPAGTAREVRGQIEAQQYRVAQKQQSYEANPSDRNEKILHNERAALEKLITSYDRLRVVEGERLRDIRARVTLEEQFQRLADASYVKLLQQKQVREAFLRQQNQLTLANDKTFQAGADALALQQGRNRGRQNVASLVDPDTQNFRKQAEALKDVDSIQKQIEKTAERLKLAQAAGDTAGEKQLILAKALLELDRERAKAALGQASRVTEAEQAYVNLKRIQMESAEAAKAQEQTQRRIKTAAEAIEATERKIATAEASGNEKRAAKLKVVIEEQRLEKMRLDGISASSSAYQQQLILLQEAEKKVKSIAETERQRKSAERLQASRDFRDGKDPARSETTLNNALGARNALFTAEGLGSLLKVQAALLANYTILNTITSAIRSATMVTIEFEAELRNLQAIANATEGEFGRIRETIEKISSTTKFGAVELAQAGTLLAQAGQSFSQIDQNLGAIARFAQATGTDLKTAVDIVTTTLTVFKKNADETVQITNIFTEALNRSKLSMEQLQLGFQYAANIVADAGGTFEELTATLAGMSQAGIRSGSTLGTGLRQIFIELANPSEKLQGVLQRLGLTISDVDVRTHGIVGVLEKFREHGLTAADAMAAFETRTAAALIAAKNQTSFIRDIEEGMLLSNSVAEAAGKQDKSFKNTAATLKNAIEVMIASGLEPLLNSATSVMKVLTSITNTVAEWKGTITTAVTVIAGALSGMLAGAIIAVSGKALSFGKDMVVAAAGLVGLGKAAEGTAIKMTMLQRAMGIGTAVGAVLSILSLMVDLFSRGGTSAENLAKGLDELKTKFNETQGRIDANRQSSQQLADTIERLNRRKDDLIDNEKELRVELIRASDQFNKFGANIDLGSDKIDTLISKLQRLFKTMREGRFQDLGTQVGNVAEQMVTNEKQIVEGGNDFRQSVFLPGGSYDKGTFQAKGAYADIPAEILKALLKIDRQPVDPNRTPTELFAIRDMFAKAITEANEKGNTRLAAKISEFQRDQASKVLGPINERLNLIRTQRNLTEEQQTVDALRQNKNVSGWEARFAREQASIPTVKRNLGQWGNDYRTRFTGAQVDLGAALQRLRDIEAEMKTLPKGQLEELTREGQPLSKLGTTISEVVKTIVEETEHFADEEAAQAKADLKTLRMKLATNSKKRENVRGTEPDAVKQMEDLQKEKEQILSEIRDAELRRDKVRPREIINQLLNKPKDRTLEDEVSQINERYDEGVRQTQEEYGKAIEDIHTKAINEAKKDATRRLGTLKEQLSNKFKSISSNSSEEVVAQTVDEATSLKNQAIEALKEQAEKDKQLRARDRNASPKDIADRDAELQRAINELNEDFDNKVGTAISSLRDVGKFFSGIVSTMNTKIKKAKIAFDTIKEDIERTETIENTKLGVLQYQANRGGPATNAMISNQQEKIDDLRYQSQVRLMDAELEYLAKEREAMQTALSLSQTVNKQNLSVTSSNNNTPVTAAGQRGWRNNNPGNLKDSGKPWLGQTGVDEGGFAQFESAAFGLRAMMKQLQTYQNRDGRNTIASIMDKYDKGNPQYSATLAKELGVTINDKLDLNNEDMLRKLAEAMVKVETPQAAKQLTPETWQMAQLLLRQNDTKGGLTGTEAMRLVLEQMRTNSDDITQRKVAENLLKNLEDNKITLDNIGENIQNNLAKDATLQGVRTAFKEQQGKTYAPGERFNESGQTWLTKTSREIGDVEKYLSNELPGVLDQSASAFSSFFQTISSGAASVGSAFRSLAQGILKAMLDVVTSMVAKQFLTMILGAAFGGGTTKGTLDAGSGTTTTVMTANSGGFVRKATGGLILKRFAAGGISTRDSVPALLRPGEYVLRNSAVEAIGRENLDQINAMGNRAVSTGTPQINSSDDSQGGGMVNVWVVSADQVPPPGEKDIIAYVANDLAKGGITKKLVKQVQMGAL